MLKDVGKTKGKRIRGSASDDTLSYATTLDPNLEQWRVLAAEWLGTLREAKDQAMKGLKILIHPGFLWVIETGYRSSPPQWK